MKKEIFVKDKRFYLHLFAIAMPIIAQNLITIGVNMMDTIMLGKCGEVQLSASSLANDFINIFQILCMGLGCGAAVLTAQYWGAGNLEDLKKTVSVMLRIGLVTAICFCLCIAFFPQEIMGIYSNEIEVIEKGALYFAYSIPTFLLTAISLTLTQVLRSVRLVRIPLYSSIVSFFVNIFFNWVFIFGKLGAPRMEIAGAALGTVLARVVETVIIGGYFFVKDDQIGYRIHDLFRPCGSVLQKYMKYCVPVLLSDCLLAFGNTAVSIIVGHMGMIFAAAYSIIAVLMRLATVATQGIGQASHMITGNTLGEGKTEQAYREAITMLSLSFALGCVTSLVLRVVGEPMIRLYDIQPQTYATALQMLDAVCIMIIFQSMQSVMTKGILRGGGDTKFCLAIDAVFLWVLSVPLGYFTGLVWHCNAFVVFLALRCDNAVKTILGTQRILSRKWIHTLAQ